MPKAPSQPSLSGLPQERDLVNGTFVIERVLGVGGMGGVFAARDLRNDRRVALKLMLPELAADAHLVTRFVREARAMATLRSEHVARVFDVGNVDGMAPFMVMELLEGRDLHARLRDVRTLSIAETVRCVIETCDAVAEAHHHDIVHRDLKPSNLFLAEQPEGPPKTKVLDFGISKQISLDAATEAQVTQLTTTQSLLGSPHFMSPEQLRSSKHVDKRTDIWSLGVVLHKCLTGKLPFDSETLGAYLLAAAGEPPTPIRRHRPDAPAELEEIVLRCLQRHLPLRYQNVGQLAIALAPFAPPGTDEVVERIVSLVGRDPSTTPLPVLSAIPDVPFPAPYAVSDGVRPAAADAPTRVGFRPSGRGVMPTPAEATNPDAVVPVVAKEAGRKRQRYVFLGAPLGAALLFVAGIGVQRVVGSAPAAPGAAAAVPSPPAEVTVMMATAPQNATPELDGEPVRATPLLLPDGAVSMGTSPPSAVSVARSPVPSAAAPPRAAPRRPAPATETSATVPPTLHRPKARLETDL
jgi:serine/threonine protein kinase